MYELVNRYKYWKFKNTFLLAVGLVLFLLIADTSLMKDLIDGIGSFGYFGVFLVGMFFVSTFTVAPASVTLFQLAKEFELFEMVLFAGLGGVLGDYLIFRFLKDRVFEEMRPVFARFEGFRLLHLFRTPYFAWFSPVFGAILIALPLPNEFGISLLGISRLKTWQFMIISFALNMLAVLAIVSLARAL